jgi:hypothetical protein
MRIFLQVRPYIQSNLLVHYKRTSESEKVQKRTEKGSGKRTEKESNKRIESVGDSRVRKVRVRGRASGGVRWVGQSESGCVRRWGGTYRGVVGIAGSKVDDRVSERAANMSGRAADGVLVGSAGVPLTITPPLEKHRLGAWSMRGIGRKGMEPKAMARMRRGAAGLLAWNSATLSGALLIFPASSQVLPSVP